MLPGGAKLLNHKGGSSFQLLFISAFRLVFLSLVILFLESDVLAARLSFSYQLITSSPRVVARHVDGGDISRA